MDFDPRWGDAIAHIESGGEASPYASVTTNPNGKRALGKYQVMDFNVPEWTEKALGRSLTPEQFLKDSDAQEAVFRHRFGGYVDKYGNPQDAASAWFTGGPRSYGANKRDMFGTTGNSYVAKFDGFLGGGPTAIQQAMNTNKGTSPMAFADDDSGALSTNNVIGGGVLNSPRQGLGSLLGIPESYGLQNRVLTAASALTSASDPDQAKVLAGLRKDPAQHEYSFITMPDGTLMRVNKNGSYEKLPGNYAKPDKGADKVDPSVLKSLAEDWTSKYGNIQYSAERAAKFRDMFEKGEIDPTVLGKGQAAWENLFGKSSPKTQALNDFTSFRTQMANDSLRLNKGVQTEGDASRAKDELITAIASNDPASIKNALHNYVAKTGKVMQEGARSQLDSYSSAYKNQAAFKPYYDRLESQQKFYDAYHKNHPDAAPSAPIAPGTRPPLTDIFK
jgi:hypothetical protein